MLNFVKNLMGLNSTLAMKIQSDRLYEEGMAFSDAGESENAFQRFQRSSDLGNKDATVQAAKHLLKGQGIACDWQSAAKFLELAVAREVPNVSINLGIVYGIGGYGLKRDLVLAEYHFNQAIALDQDDAAHQMLDKLRRKQPPFGGKELPRPKIPWK